MWPENSSWMPSDPPRLNLSVGSIRLSVSTKKVTKQNLTTQRCTRYGTKKSVEIESLPSVVALAHRMRCVVASGAGDPATNGLKRGAKKRQCFLHSKLFRSPLLYGSH